MTKSPTRIRAMHLMAWEAIGFDRQAAAISLSVTSCLASIETDPPSMPDEDYIFSGDEEDANTMADDRVRIDCTTG